MGMNYFLRTGNKIKKTCDLGCEHILDEEIHIGKSSFGRYFTLHNAELPDGRRLDSLNAWKKFVSECPAPKIVDENEEEIPQEKMWKIITREGVSPAPGALKIFKEDMIGKVVDRGYEQHYLHYDVWGERGFVYTNGSIKGEDGLYVLLSGEFL